MTSSEMGVPALWPPKTILSDWDDARLARALKEADETWIDHFIKRLNFAVKEIDRKK